MKNMYMVSVLLAVMLTSMTVHPNYPNFAQPEHFSIQNTYTFSSPDDSSLSIPLSITDSYIYRYAFISYSGHPWQQVTLQPSGTGTMGTHYISESAAATIQLNPGDFGLSSPGQSSQNNYIVTYTCNSAGNCHDGWQIEQFTVSIEAAYYTVTASSFENTNTDFHPPEDTVDGDMLTRWSAEGIGEWIQFAFSEPKTINTVSIAFFNGDKRNAYISIQLSNDSQSWTEVFNGQSSGTTLNFEDFSFQTTTASYLRIIGNGNSINNWNSYNEIAWSYSTSPQPSCHDGIMNQDETGIDCGGVCVACPTPVNYLRTFYVSSSSGNDAWSGKAPAWNGTDGPWQTISKVNSMTFQPGDVVLFRKGDVWRETLSVSSSGNAINYITFGAYGTGDKPKILGSEAVTGWNHISGNVWQSTNTFTYDPWVTDYGSTIFFENNDGSVSWGHHVDYDASFSGMENEYDWTMNNGYLYIYYPFSASPSERYYSVEVPQRRSDIELNAHSYLVFDNLHLRYAISNGIHEQYGVVGIPGLNVTNCEIAYMSYKGSGKGYGIAATSSDAYYAYNTIHDCGRRAISINVYDTNPAGTMENVLIEHNHFYNGYHTTGVDAANSGAHTIRNITIRNNFFEGTPSMQLDGVNPNSNHIFIADQGDGGMVGNISIYNNIFTYAHGKSIAFERIEGAKIYYNTFYGWNPTLSNCQNFIALGSDYNHNIDIKNNIIYNDRDFSSNRCLYNILVHYPSVFSFFFDYNLHYATDPARYLFIFFEPNVDDEYTMSQWSSYLSDYAPNDAHSPVPADPLFIDPQNGDFHLQAASPAVHAGTPISGITTDYEGNLRDPAHPSIGALEYTQ